MAKKKTSRGDVNMAEEIRTLLTANAKQTSTDVYNALVEKFPNRTINRSSVNVAFSNARRKLGIKPGKGRSVRRRRPGAGTPTVTRRSGVAIDMALLKSARKFLQEAGNSQTAITAIQQVEALQVGS